MMAVFMLHLTRRSAGETKAVTTVTQRRLGLMFNPNVICCWNNSATPKKWFEKSENQAAIHTPVSCSTSCGACWFTSLYLAEEVLRDHHTRKHTSALTLRTEQLWEDGFSFPGKSAEMCFRSSSKHLVLWAHKCVKCTHWLYKKMEGASRSVGLSC